MASQAIVPLQGLTAFSACWPLDGPTIEVKSPVVRGDSLVGIGPAGQVALALSNIHRVEARRWVFE
jgi:hypothetical protein